MKEFWRSHEWPAGERRYHWLVVFDDQPEVHECHAAHVPVLARFEGLIDPVPPEWLHLTLQSLCPTTAATGDELTALRAAVARRLADLPPPRVQLGPPRIDGAAVTWAVYPEQELARVQQRVREASLDVLGADRVAAQRGVWWPHVTLGYGARDDPADDLAGALVRARLPRVEVTVGAVTLVDQEQDLARRQYRWRGIASVPIGAPGPPAASL